MQILREQLVAAAVAEIVALESSPPPSYPYTTTLMGLSVVFNHAGDHWDVKYLLPPDQHLKLIEISIQAPPAVRAS